MVLKARCPTVAVSLLLLAEASYLVQLAANFTVQGVSDVTYKNKVISRNWGHERALYHRLLDGYNKHMRPVKTHNDTVIITIGVKLNQILDLQEKMQVLTTIVAVDQEWYDHFLQWNPEDFGGLNSTYLPCSQVWLPDIVLYNGVSNIRELPYMQSHVSVRHDGHVVWFPLVKLESACKLDVEFYPFDEQMCQLKFGSWSYSKVEVDVSPGYTAVEKHDYVDSGEFELVSLTVSRRENAYDCCPIPIPTLNVNLHFRRRPLFALFTLALPCTLLSLMTTVAFVLPPDSSAKIEVQLSVMLSLTVFMLMIGESMPPTSDTLPLLGVHVVIQMGVTALSFICSIIVLRIVKTDHKCMNPRVKQVTKLLSKWLLVAGFPDDGTTASRNSTQAKYDWKLLLKCTKAVLNVVGAPRPPNSTAAAFTSRMASCASIHAQNGLSNFDGSCSPMHQGAAAASGHKAEREVFGQHAQQILERMTRDDERQGRKGDWMLLGLVIDRCLLLLLLLVDFATSIYIYCFAPTQHLTDN